MAYVAHPVLAGERGGDVDAEHTAERQGDLTNRDRSAGGNVQSTSVGLGAVQSQQIGGDYVVNAHEVTHLLAIFKDKRRLLIEQPRSKDRGHAGVRVRERLARTIDVEVAKSNHRQAVS